MADKKIPGGRLVLATISVLRTLVFELSRRGVSDQAQFVALVQETAISHREAGDPNNLADAIHASASILQIQMFEAQLLHRTNEVTTRGRRHRKTQSADV